MPDGIGRMDYRKKEVIEDFVRLAASSSVMRAFGQRFWYDYYVDIVTLIVTLILPVLTVYSNRRHTPHSMRPGKY